MVDRPFSVLVSEPGELPERVSRHFTDRGQAARFAKGLIERGTDPDHIYLGIDHGGGTVEATTFKDSELS